MFEGLTGAGVPRLERGPDESTQRFAARLLGRFLAWVDSTRRPLEDELMSTATPYLTIVAASIADGDWDPSLRDAAALFRIHTVAMVYAERRAEAPAPVAHENLLISWLTAQAGMRPVEETGAVLGQRRQRRHAKLFGPDDAG
jgi:hypothetical protein